MTSGPANPLVCKRCNAVINRYHENHLRVKHGLWLPKSQREMNEKMPYPRVKFKEYNVLVVKKNFRQGKSGADIQQRSMKK